MILPQSLFHVDVDYFLCASEVSLLISVSPCPSDKTISRGSEENYSIVTPDFDLSMSHQPRVLFIDAYDSFSENIVALLRRELNTSVSVIKIDADPAVWKWENLTSFCGRFTAVVLGPGPGNPTNENDTGLFNLVWKVAEQNTIPVLGICLGFQSLCATFGLPISRLDIPCHGHAKQIRHQNNDIFFEVGEVVASNYNSLGVRLTDSPSITPDVSRPLSSASSQSSISSHASFTSIGNAGGAVARGANPSVKNDVLLSSLAHDDDGYIMAVRHNNLPFWGLQFHPESCKSNNACQKGGTVVVGEGTGSQRQSTTESTSGRHLTHPKHACLLDHCRISNFVLHNRPCPIAHGHSRRSCQFPKATQELGQTNNGRTMSLVLTIWLGGNARVQQERSVQHLRFPRRIDLASPVRQWHFLTLNGWSCT